jgi:hypothetical protein
MTGVEVGITSPGVLVDRSGIASSVCAAAVYSGLSVAAPSGVGFTPRLQAERRNVSSAIHEIVVSLLFMRTSFSFSEIDYGLTPFSGILFKYENLENDVSIL